MEGKFVEVVVLAGADVRGGRHTWRQPMRIRASGHLWTRWQGHERSSFWAFVQCDSPMTGFRAVQHHSWCEGHGGARRNLYRCQVAGSTL